MINEGNNQREISWFRSRVGFLTGSKNACEGGGVFNAGRNFQD